MKHIFNYRWVLIVFITIMILPACAPTRFVKPLEQQQSAIGFNAGGPLIHFAGIIIPVPFSSVFYGYGLSERGTGSFGFHTTALVYETLQFDLAYTHQVLDQKSLLPGISMTGGTETMIGLREGDFRLYPTFDVNLFYEYAAQKHLSYFSFSNWFDPHSQKVVEGSDYRIWRPSLGFGHLFRWKSWEFGLEYKFLGVNLDNTKTVVNYVNDLEVGAHGVYLQFFKKF